MHLESFSVPGDAKVDIQGGGLNTGGRGRLDVVFRDEVRKPRLKDLMLVFSANRNYMATI